MSHATSPPHAGLLRMQQLFDALAEVGYIVELDMKQVADADDAMDALDMFERLSQGHKSVVLDLPTLVCNELLHQLVTVFPCIHMLSLINDIVLLFLVMKV